MNVADTSNGTVKSPSVLKEVYATNREISILRGSLDILLLIAPPVGYQKPPSAGSGD